MTPFLFFTCRDSIVIPLQSTCDAWLLLDCSPDCSFIKLSRFSCSSLSKAA